MEEKEYRPPSWGPIADPVPWGTQPIPPYPWWKYPRPIPFPIPFPIPDPIPFPAKILEKIRVEDTIALQRVNLEAAKQLFEAQVRVQEMILEKQMEILQKY